MLGLRHNFKGSLLPPGSSVMDYIDIADSISFGGARQLRHSRHPLPLRAVERTAPAAVLQR